MKILMSSFKERRIALRLEAPCSCGAKMEVTGEEIDYWADGDPAVGPFSILGLGFFCPACKEFVSVRKKLMDVDEQLVDYLEGGELRFPPEHPEGIKE